MRVRVCMYACVWEKKRDRGQLVWQYRSRESISDAHFILSRYFIHFYLIDGCLHFRSTVHSLVSSCFFFFLFYIEDCHAQCNHFNQRIVWFYLKIVHVCCWKRVANLYFGSSMFRSQLAAQPDRTSTGKMIISNYREGLLHFLISSNKNLFVSDVSLDETTWTHACWRSLYLMLC